MKDYKPLLEVADLSGFCFYYSLQNYQIVLLSFIVSLFLTNHGNKHQNSTIIFVSMEVF